MPVPRFALLPSDTPERLAQKYGDNRWWESDDARTRAYYQLFEPLWIFHRTDIVNDLQELLGRMVWYYELSDALPELRIEAQRAWGGNPYSYWERIEAQYRVLGATPDHLPGYQLYKQDQARAQQEQDHAATSS